MGRERRCREGRMILFFGHDGCAFLTLCERVAMEEMPEALRVFKYLRCTAHFIDQE
jgi:hypothetical protein